MKKHVKNYLKITGLEGEIILCEVCGQVAVDIHHIVFKGQGGSDEYDNLIALCRVCHEKAHGLGTERYSQEFLKQYKIQK